MYIEYIGIRFGILILAFLRADIYMDRHELVESSERERDKKVIGSEGRDTFKTS